MTLFGDDLMYNDSFLLNSVRDWHWESHAFAGTVKNNFFVLLQALTHGTGVDLVNSWYSGGDNYLHPNCRLH